MISPATASDLSFGADLTAITMGIDAFERRVNREAGLLDTEGLVPIYLGNDIISPRHYENWWVAEDDLNELQQRLPSVVPEHRQVFASAMIRSLKIALRLFAGSSPSFEVKVRDLVGAQTGPVEATIIEGLRDTLDTLLKRRGIVRGDLSQRISEWESSNFLEPTRIEPAFAELMGEATDCAARVRLR